MQKSSFEGCFGRVQDPGEYIFQAFKEPKIQNFPPVLESWNVSKRYTFHHLIKSTPIPGNQSSFEILQLLDVWLYQNLVILFFCSVVILIYSESRWCLSCVAGQSSFRWNVTWSWLNCWLLLPPIWLNLWSIINRIQYSCKRSLLFVLQFIYQRSLMWGHLAHSI